jgi:predicted signal transduction protein with EAL and GGDEF domain
MIPTDQCLQPDQRSGLNLHLRLIVQFEFAALDRVPQLRAVAERLQSCVRETDMVARFGGDEFAVLQDDIEHTADIETLAAKIGKILAAPFAIEGNQVQTTASIGIVPYGGDIATVDAMMMKADLALYRAKNEGRNQFRFHVAELDKQTQERIIIGEEHDATPRRDLPTTATDRGAARDR